MPVSMKNKGGTVQILNLHSCVGYLRLKHVPFIFPLQSENKV